MLSLLHALGREAGIPGRAAALASHRPTLPKFPSYTPFQRQLQLAELEYIYGSRARAALIDVLRDMGAPAHPGEQLAMRAAG